MALLWQLIAKFDEAKHHRDARGRFTETASIRVGDRDVSVVKPLRAEGDALVPLDVGKFDPRFAADPGFYLSEGGGKNAIGNRYQRFEDFINQNDSIEAPEVYVGSDGTVGFTNGRHRYAWLRDHGITTIPAAMDWESVRNAKKHGYLSKQIPTTMQPRPAPVMPKRAFDAPAHSYGNTQIGISPTSAAAISLNNARNLIEDEHLMATGKAVDGNHVTVRYGLVNDDLDALRAFLARQTPFTATVDGVELFPPSEHSDGAVPVVAKVVAPELHAIEAEIGRHADFKEKSFPVYKPHATLAYCKPEIAERYADLPVYGTFVVQGITISHSSGVQETIPFGMAQKWDASDEALHPRDKKGKFAAKATAPDPYVYSPARRLARLPTFLPKAVRPATTAFVMPDGSRLQFGSTSDEGWHMSTLGKRGYTVGEVTRLGVVRYKPGVGIEVSRPLTDEQAQLVVDDWIVERTPVLHVDVMADPVSPYDGARGETVTKPFDSPVSTTTLQAYVSHTIRMLAEKVKQQRLERGIKWDESQHPRDKEGQFTESGAAPETEVGKQIVSLIEDSGVASDYIHALYDQVDPLDAIAGSFNLDTVRDADIEYARRVFKEKSQAMLRKKFPDGNITAYRGVTGTEGKNDTISLTLDKYVALNHADRWARLGKAWRQFGEPYLGEIQEFHFKVEDVLSYGEAVGRGTFAEEEVLVLHKALVKKRQGRLWDERKHPRNPAGQGDKSGEFTRLGSASASLEVLYGPKDALDSLLDGEKNVNIDRNDVRRFMELAAELPERLDPDLTDLQVEGMEIFGGNGLGIPRIEMPQIPKEHRAEFMEFVRDQGVRGTYEDIDPLKLKPTQTQVSARNAGQKLLKYEKGGRTFPPVLVAENGRILDGHHHWGAIAAYALDDPTATIPIYRFKANTKVMLALMFGYMKKHGLKRKDISGAVQKADPRTGRYVTPFVSFDKQGDDMLRMIASLNSSRLATWGFTAEAEVRGIARYRVTAVLDGRTSDFCRMMHGKIFDVPDAREKVIEVLNVQNPEDLKVVQPWPKQTKAAMAEFREMSAEELTDLGLHIPPYHPYCRTVLLPVVSSEGDLAEEELTDTLPEEVEMFQPVTMADLAELGVEATQEQVDQWNMNVGMSPVELLSKFSGVPPQEIMTKGQGVGANPIQFSEAGIGMRARGEVAGVEFKIGALLDPFTGIYYLTQADLLTGTPLAEVKFLKRMFNELIGIGEASPSAKALAVGVAGNAAYYAKLGFLPDDIEWDTIRYSALESLDTTLKPLLDTLSAEDQVLVRHLLQDKSVGALSALVDLPFTYEGRTLGEWVLGDIGGTWALDLLDDALVSHAKAYLS